MSDILPKSSPTPSLSRYMCMGKWLRMAIILCHQDFHTLFDQQTTAEITGPNCKEGVNALNLVTKHLPDIPSKRAEA
eukprot:15285750-Ditylum_brightwellii.AAC.1